MGVFIMGTRFRKSVKICKGVKVNFSKSGASLSLGGRGHSLNLGGRGARVTVGIPGTGLSYSTKLGSNSKRKSSSSSHKRSSGSRASRSKVSVPGQVRLSMNEKGQITILDSNGSPITDEYVLRKIRSTDAYKQQKAALEIQRKQKIEEIVQNASEENAKFINIYTFSPIVESKSNFEKRYNSMEPEQYCIPAPTENEIKNDLMNEAEENVKAPFWKKGKLQKQYVEDNFSKRMSDAINVWNADKEASEKLFAEEYESNKSFLRKLIDGNENTICESFDSWIASCELPVEININYEFDSNEKTLLLDVDLPEIEDLPETIMTKTDSGNLKEKKKTQGEKRGEYATCVFGLAVFVSSNAFNISPDIQKILISGYTQRRDKDGNLNDDYIYSFKFTRDKFEGINVNRINPQEICMSVPNRCNMTSTALFKTIKPFDKFDEN